MNTVAGTSPVPLTVFGGAVTEMAPEDLPEGASPFSQDVDFVPGAVFTRGGRQSVYSFAGLAIEDLAGFANSLPGLFAPNEVAWNAPSNATLNTPGTYAEAILNSGGSGSAPGLDQTVTASETSAATTLAYGGFTPRAGSEIVIMATDANVVTSVTPNGAAIGVSGYMFSSTLTTPTTYTAHFSAGQNASIVAASFFGSSLGVSQSATAGAIGNLGFTNPVPSTHAIVVGLSIFTINVAPGTYSVTDDKGNTYTTIGVVNHTNGANFGQAGLWVCQNPQGGPKTITVTQTSGGTIFGVQLSIADLTGLATPGSAGVSQILQASNFNFNIPSSEAILGVQLEIFGHQTTQPPDAILTANLLTPGLVQSPFVPTGQLPTIDGQLTLGRQSQLWQLPLTPALLNSPSFAAQIVASASTFQAFDIYAVKLKVFTSPATPSNFLWVKTYEQTSGQIDTLALDANGILYDENVTSVPLVLNTIYTGINPGSYAKSVTFQNVEYIALSNLINGTDIPRHWDGTFLDRVSQVGPGAPPSVNATSTIFQIAPAPGGITQPPAVTIGDVGGGGGHGGISSLLWSAGSGNTSIGNTLTLYYGRVTVIPPDPNIIVGRGIFLAGLPTVNGQNPNGDYIVTSVGTGVPPNSNFGTANQYFTVIAASSQSAFVFQANNPLVGSSYQATAATVTTLTPLPNTQVGSQITITGDPNASWDASWTVLATPNAAQMSITSTQLSANVATYTFTLISGVAPVVGQQVTVVGCLNGPIVGGTSIFNISNGIISATGANQFSIAITAPNVLPAAETGNATVNGTKFIIDPGIQFAGSATNPIFGNSGGGTVVVGGAGLGAGVRKAVVSFLTRNTLITGCSFPVIFNTTGGSTSLAFQNIPIGPPDTIARIIAITGAGGSSFFWIPTPVIVQVAGQNITYTSTRISDNTTTSAVLTFTDAVLTSGIAIDVPGNNLFTQMELGSCRGFLTYANRLFAWGEQNKIQNLLNLSFEGGVGTSASGLTTYPLGWTVDPTNGAGGNLRVSPIFGNSYYILNSTGITQTLYGMIEQNAYQDPYQVAIVQPNTTYSARVTARCPSGAVTGNLVVDFFSPLQNRIFGSFSIPLSSMTSNFKIFTGTLLTASFSTVPADLIFRVYASALPNLGDVEIDRVEPFPTLQPVFSTQLRASYAGNQEAFDLITGATGPAQNQQPINGAFVQDELLYALKEKSTYYTSDNGTTEPNQWQWKEKSPQVGTIGPLSYDTGEGWMLTACRPGVYFFEGGEMLKISQEIQSVWDLINWNAGQTIWLRNDQQLKRITIGVPIPTPNPFMPEFPLNANPTSPNVILQCSYRELNSGQELARIGPIRSTFSGRLMSPEPARKWSFWNIACPYADFIRRGDNTWPEFFCSGYANSKIFQLSSAELDDDGNPINSFYVTYGFVKPEMADAKGLGLFRMELGVVTMLLIGSGSALFQVYPESVQNPLPYQEAVTSLAAFSGGDTEFVCNITGNRFFMRIGSNAIGSAWRLSKVVAALEKDAWSEISGVGVRTA